MRAFTRKQKIVAALSGAGLAVAVGGSAFAFYTLGQGDGSVSTEPYAGVDITQVGDIDDLVPNVPSTVTLDVTNNTGGNIIVGYIDISLPPGWSEGSCDASDFDLTHHILVPAPVVKNGGVVTVEGQITLKDKGDKDQTGCLGLTDIPLQYTAHH